MNHRTSQILSGFLSAFVALLVLLAAPAAYAADEAPDALIKRLSTDVLDTIKADKSLQSGNLPQVIALVDSKIMPNVDFQRMTASAAGPGVAQGNARAAKTPAGRIQDPAGAHLCRRPGAGQ